MKQNTKTVELYEQLKNILLSRGGSYWDTYDALQTIDALAYTAVVDSVIEKLDLVKVDELQKLIESNSNAEKLSEFLNLSSEKLEELHEQKLAEFITAFETKRTTEKTTPSPSETS